MNISKRIMFGILAATLPLSLASTPAVFAQDAMQQDIDFKNRLSKHDGAKNETISNGAVKKSRDAGIVRQRRQAPRLGQGRSSRTLTRAGLPRERRLSSQPADDTSRTALKRPSLVFAVHIWNPISSPTWSTIPFHQRRIVTEKEYGFTQV
jgi:pentapeptide MXKDX repeat protein